MRHSLTSVRTRVTSTLVLAAVTTVATAAATAATPRAAAATRTRTRIYSPFTATGHPAGHLKRTVSGSCFNGSLAVPHRGAWRCMSANTIYDPCFSSAKASGLVLCPASGPSSAALIKITLSRPLPGRKFANHAKPSKSGLPWALKTTAGWGCRLDTGATTTLDGKRLNYFCTGTKNGLWGSPQRTSEPWRILAARPQASALTRSVGIASAWF